MAKPDICPSLLSSAHANTDGVNEKFFALPQERQRSILAAAYKVFARNGYKHAPMSEIAASANISKSLLFHYFRNKASLYVFLWNTAMGLTAQATGAHRILETDDFFEMLRRSLQGKCDLMRAYPYISLFALNAYYEQDPEVRNTIQNSFAASNERSFQAVQQAINPQCLRPGLALDEVYRETIYASDGFMAQRYREEYVDVDEIEREFTRMIDFWRRAYGV